MSFDDAPDAQYSWFYRKKRDLFLNLFSEVGIYKRKQESKKTKNKKTRKKERKQKLDQESDQEKRKLFLFLGAFLFSFFFLVFFYKFPPQGSHLVNPGGLYLRRRSADALPFFLKKKNPADIHRRDLQNSASGLFILIGFKTIIGHILLPRRQLLFSLHSMRRKKIYMVVLVGWYQIGKQKGVVKKLPLLVLHL